ncbi:trypco2 family protein [Pseudomonas petrae]|uniref:Trypsin-co-occurring domain-containing protein n=1 Tax=Pseudomonas petrae TaxID=2912190 RepID=A0ABS9IEJ7_9PSED|nr:trypco2 family protein [Pseudomonas petrae]MCF7545496.1 hypothetical protein [Pseudomonas petrae]
MKGMISLVDFIKEVKNELRAAVDEEDPFFEMGDVELEVTFALDASAKAGAKLFVVDIGGETKATQSHKVTVKLHPFVESDSSQQIPTERAQKGVGMVTPYKGSKQRTKKTTEPHSNRVRVAPTANKPSQSTSVRRRPPAG